jgi:hypothetical protein
MKTAVSSENPRPSTLKRNLVLLASYLAIMLIIAGAYAS